jgi:hypothetical protein
LLFLKILIFQFKKKNLPAFGAVEHKKSPKAFYGHGALVLAAVAMLSAL